MYDDLYSSPYFASGGCSVPGSWWEPTRKLPQGDWTCEYCGSLHPGTAYTCIRCGAPRRAERPKPAPLVSSAQAAIWAVAPRKPTCGERLRSWWNQRKWKLRNEWYKLFPHKYDYEDDDDY